MEKQQREQQLERQVAGLHGLITALLTTQIMFRPGELDTLQNRFPTYMGQTWVEILDALIGPSGGTVDTPHSKCGAARRVGSNPTSGTKSEYEIIGYIARSMDDRRSGRWEASPTVRVPPKIYKTEAVANRYGVSRPVYVEVSK